MKNMDYDQWELENSDKGFIRTFILFAFMILVSQTLQFINTKIIDSKHNRNLTERNIIIQSSQADVMYVNNIQRALLNMVIVNDSSELAGLKQRMISCSGRHDRSVKAITSAYASINGNDTAILAKLLSADLVYKNACDIYTGYLNKNEKEKAISYRTTGLRPSLEAYLAIQQELMFQVTNQSLTQSNDVNSYATISGWVLFIIGIFPYIYILFTLNKIVWRNIF